MRGRWMTRFGQLMGHGADDDRAIVTSTWELSLDALAARGRPQARPLLRVLSCLAPAALIPPWMLDLNVLGQVCENGEDGAAEGLTALASVGLITTSPGAAGTRPSVTVHLLVTETNRLRLDAEDPARTGGIAVALIAVAASGLHHDRPGDWPAWVQLVPHLNAVYVYLAGRLADADLAALAKITESAAMTFVWAGSYPASQELALKHAARLGTKHPAVLSLRFQVAIARKFRGEDAEAETELRDVLAARVQVLGPGHPDTLTTRHEIARVLAERRQYEQAEQEWRQVLDARAQGNDPDTLSIKYEMARMHRQQDSAGCPGQFPVMAYVRPRQCPAAVVASAYSMSVPSAV